MTRRPAVVGVGLAALVVVPLVIGLVAFNRPQWHPIADLAQTELRVRDVGTGDTPLIGLPGRIGPWFQQGSHAGPLSFLLLAPVYRLLGGTAFAFSASSVVLHAVAMGLSLWIAHRRGGVRLMVGVGLTLVMVARAYGMVVYLEPWNPYLPVSWWVTLLLAVWSVLDDDPPMLVVAVVAGSLAAQTHLPYLGLVGGLGALALGASVLAVWRGRPDDPPGARARRLRWLAVAGLVGVVLWLPPLVDQVSETGNLGVIRESLEHPDDDPVGLVDGVEEVVYRLGFEVWVRAEDVKAAPAQREQDLTGVLVVGAWAVAAAACALGRVGTRSLRHLHLVLAVALGLAVVASSRVHGELWYYLYLWVFGVAALMLLATAWTLVLAVAPRVDPERRADLATRATVGVASVAVVLAVLFGATGFDAEPSRPDLSGDLGVIADDTATALASGEVVGGGRDGRYLVRWIDPVTIGSQGIGLVNELEREGFSVGVTEGFGVSAARHRVLDPADATAIVQLVVGPEIEAWQADPEATEVAYLDPRTPAERDESAARAQEIDAALVDAGLPEVAETWRRNVFTASLDPEVPAPIRADMVRVLDIGAPVAVFVAPPDHP